MVLTKRTDTVEKNKLLAIALADVEDVPKLIDGCHFDPGHVLWSHR